MSDPREEKLPVWAKELIAHLRREIQVGREPLIDELNTLRPKVELLKASNAGMQALMECAAKGGHVTSTDITSILAGYELELVRYES
jgi:hypothetical protein